MFVLYPFYEQILNRPMCKSKFLAKLQLNQQFGWVCGRPAPLVFSHTPRNLPVGPETRAAAGLAVNVTMLLP